MMIPPGFFEGIRLRASRQWNQLERDRDLAGPWHQLFKQVQSPRHVVSELLQNADDAGATEASVIIQNREFIFCHNGEDFSEEHFSSLCRFGYSNKRALHTIGFRGIGFKSTFSLGDVVRLFTPTLSVTFQRHRFTEPTWFDHRGPKPTRTEIRVVIKDEHRLRELEKNLNEWLKSPGSLLFFRGIRRLIVDGQEVRWISQGKGPVDNSEWMVLSTESKKKYLLIRSEAENFPDEALDEIRKERMVPTEEEVSFPPCRVEIVLGMEGRLFVVLPTGVQTRLPFGCNAPFVQDPARVKIKDPEISPTNRWLLNRIGRLASQSMLTWLNRSDLSQELRCDAYMLFPNVDKNDNSLEGSCAIAAEESFKEAISGTRFLLSEEGHLHSWGKCVAVPRTILEIWSPEQVTAFFVKNHQILCQHVGHDSLERLVGCGSVSKLEKSDILNVLPYNHLPKPTTWRQLLLLWSYLSSDVTGYYSRLNHKVVRIVPVQGKDVLYAANEVVRLGEKRLLQSQDDWNFLAEYLLVLNQNWTRFLADKRREAEERKDELLGSQVESAYKVLEALNLQDSSDVNRVIEQVADKFFSKKTIRLAECVRLAHLAATLSVSVSDNFQFVTRNSFLKAVKQSVIADPDGDIDTFVSQDWYEGHVLHGDYFRNFSSCTEAQWKHWVFSNQSKVVNFVPLIQNTTRFYSERSMQKTLSDRGYRLPAARPYSGSEFALEDWDFDEQHWSHWEALAANDEMLWGRILRKILMQPSSYWSHALTATVFQIASRGRGAGNRSTVLKDIPATWINKFRELSCLQDTRGRYRQPAELLRRTAETESLLDVEPFVRAEFDNESSRPLLTALGVRDTPTGPDGLLDRLFALSKAKNPPLHEVEKWYRRLDNLVGKCSTEEIQKIIKAFHDNKIILLENNQWARASEAFLSSDEEDFPGASVVHPSVRHLALWPRIEVADRPTGERAIKWLKGFPSGQALPIDQARRVKPLLSRFPHRVWNEVEHWLNLESEWIPINRLTFALTMQSLVTWKHLFPAIKQKTADLMMLSNEVCQTEPFFKLPRLTDAIEDRFQERISDMPIPQTKPWLVTLGSGLRRIVLNEDGETLRVRAIADRLARTVWQVSVELETIPYIAGVPAGTSRRTDALWKDFKLYVADRSPALMANPVAQELGRAFERPEIVNAIKLCYDRPRDFIMEYLEGNFTLAPPEEIQPTNSEDVEGTNTPQSTSNCETIGAADTREPKLGSEPTTREGQENVTGRPWMAQEIADGNKLAIGEVDGDSVVEEPESLPIRPSHPRIDKPSLIERFATSHGYIKDSEDRFYHADGSWFQKVSGNDFPWERCSKSGDLVQSYWPKDHCIEREPLQLAADLWSLCDKFPDRYSLLLADPNGEPVEISGRRLRELCDRGELILHPATYRLVYRSE